MPEGRPVASLLSSGFEDCSSIPCVASVATPMEIGDAIGTRNGGVRN